MSEVDSELIFAIFRFALCSNEICCNWI